MTDTLTPSISYVDAIATCDAAHDALLGAGPAACKLAGPVYAKMLGDLRKVAELLTIIEQKRAARAAREGS